MGEQNQTTIFSKPPAIRVQIEKGVADRDEYLFKGPFRCGRDPSCEVRLSDTAVSRFHAEIWFSDGQWWILDLQSANGSFLDGKQVERAPILTLARLQLGDDGPVLRLTVEGAAVEEAGSPPDAIAQREVRQPDRPASIEHYQEHYFQDKTDSDVGEHTLMIREAFKKVQKRQRGRFAAVIALLSCLVLAVGIYAFYKHQQVSKQKLLAEEIFYAMKSMELEFAPLVEMARKSRDALTMAQVRQYRVRRKAMESKYDKFIEELEIYKKSISAEERLILKVARMFGECEIKMPAGFVKEVLNYIEKWKASARMKNAIQRAHQRGYTRRIVETFRAYDLPPQFYYLALQESNFEVEACGPATRWGIAKGMWQFIPSTAEKYGLRTGPLQHLRRPDPQDERHSFKKSTAAAAKYIKAIYDTDAQASGLLVMASYNWGERRVNRLIKTMPENPQKRNFWQLLKKFKKQIPFETYDYVFHIFSAAVIGQNPQLFGFDFDNPLAHFDRQV
ncbi:MAG: transglycosylase SLT domain-containing protein [Desulfobacterales bacterium]|nr:transglycosylase SLT domain-containing protein [Desulfobacterales bacterium]